MKGLGLVVKLFVFVVIVLLLSLLGYAVFGNKVFLKPSPLVGHKAADFTLELFNGDKLKLSDLRGKAVLLNFWASWCIPCKDEAPALEGAWRKYKDKPVVFIGIDVWDDKSSALTYLKQFDGGYMNGIDPKGKIAVDYGVGGVPETYFIDTSGKVIDKYIGPLTEEMIDYFLKRALLPSPLNGVTKEGD
jgi:cytochrome c biogenesis protein CcmG, thiol:disulfide interchange protein DsbE